jgi:hypothetical protein
LMRSNSAIPQRSSVASERTIASEGWLLANKRVGLA